MNIFKYEPVTHTSAKSSDDNFETLISRFDRECPSAPMEREMKQTDDIEDFLEKNRQNMITQTLPEHLNLLLLRKGIGIPDVIRGSMLDRTYVYQIFSGKKKPSRDKLIALAFGLYLSDEETQKMLKLSGNRPLYIKDERDVLILFALQKEMSILEVNELLFSHNFELLGSPSE